MTGLLLGHYMKPAKAGFFVPFLLVYWLFILWYLD